MVIGILIGKVVSIVCLTSTPLATKNDYSSPDVGTLTRCWFYTNCSTCGIGFDWVTPTT
jgi:hypothetical protein